MQGEYTQSTTIRRIVSARQPSLDHVLDGQCLPVSGLTLDVIRPAVVDPDIKLPVAVVSTSEPKFLPFLISRP